MSGQQLFIFTAGNPDAQAHLDDSIKAQLLGSVCHGSHYRFVSCALDWKRSLLCQRVHLSKTRNSKQSGNVADHGLKSNLYPPIDSQ